MAGQRVNAENVNRKSQLAPKVIFVVVFFFIVFAFEMYLAYNYLAFFSVNTPMHNIAIMNFLYSLNGLFKYFNLPLIPTFLPMLKSVGSVWYLNVALFAFLMLTVRRANKFRGMEHGSARWANKRERKLFLRKKVKNVIPIADEMYINVNKPQTYNTNEIIIGGSGSGKSFQGFIAHLLEMEYSGVVIDVKGSLYKQTYKILKKHGFDIRVFNLNNLKYSNTFNPFVYLTDSTDVDKLVETFVVNSRREGGQTGEGFWEDTLSMLLCATINYLMMFEDEEKTFYRCLKLAASIELINGQIAPHCEMAQAMQRAAEIEPDCPAIINWNNVKIAPAETLQSVVISLTSRLRLWANKDLRVLTATDEMNFDDLPEKKVVIFLIIEEGDRTYRSISSMFISTVVSRLKYLTKTKYDGKLPRLVSYELDEFTNAGILPNWEETVSTIRSQNMRVVMGIQNLQQLKKNYEKSYETIMDNCSIINVFAAAGNSTAEMIVKKLDKTTISEDNLSYKSTLTGSGSSNIQERGKGRDLMTVSEIRTKPKDKAIVIIDNFHPFFVDKYKTHLHPEFPNLGHDDASHPHAKNNTKIEVEYAKLYKQHVAEYNAALQAKATQTDFFDDFADESEKPIVIETQDEIENEFLKTLKEANI